MKLELHFCSQTVDEFVAWDYNWKPLNYDFQVSPMGWMHFPDWDSRLLLHGTFHTVWVWMLVGPVWWCMCYYSPLQFLFFLMFVSVQLLSHVWLFVTPWTAACQASLSITNSWSLLKFMSIKSVMPSNHLILCHSLLLLSSIFPSIRVFSNDGIVNHKLALAKSFCQWLNSNNKGICGDWTLCCCSCQPSTPPEGDQGGEWGTLCSRETGVTGLWIVRLFPGTDFMIPILVSLQV